MPNHALSYRKPARARIRWLAALLAIGLGAAAAHAQTLSVKAKESGCIDTPKRVDGAATTYRCATASGASAYFNVPEGGEAAPPPPRRAGNPIAPAAPAPPPSTAPTAPGLPRVDAATQRGRDELRRKVLQDELAAEEKQLLESRSAYANGAPAALAEEQSNAQRYAERIAKLRQSVQLHERNVEALRRELGLPR